MDTVTKASIIGIPVATLAIAAAVAATYHNPSQAQQPAATSPAVVAQAYTAPPPPAGMPPAPPPNAAYAPAPMPAYANAPAGAPNGAAPSQVFSQPELDQMLAPVALYPDQLLSQVLMAATYPLEVVQADRWVKANPGLRGDAAVQAAQNNNWDPSVISLVAFPQVLDMMDQKVDWTERLGDAFLSQQAQVMDTVQNLRRRAAQAGNLRSNQYLTVQQDGPEYLVGPANPDDLYVPYYDPNVVYGAWSDPGYPPVYWAPERAYYPGPLVGGFTFGTGIALSAGFFFGAFDWHHHHAEVANVRPFYYRHAIDRQASFARSHPASAGAARPLAALARAPGEWHHDPAHRGNAPYRDPALRRQFANAAPAAARAPRNDFRAQTVPGQQARPAVQGFANTQNTQQANAARAEQQRNAQQRTAQERDQRGAHQGANEQAHAGQQRAEQFRNEQQQRASAQRNEPQRAAQQQNEQRAAIQRNEPQRAAPQQNEQHMAAQRNEQQRMMREQQQHGEQQRAAQQRQQQAAQQGQQQAQQQQRAAQHAAQAHVAQQAPQQHAAPPAQHAAPAPHPAGGGGGGRHENGEHHH